ncbi:TAP42-like protein [Tricharina praecox]|uniref:TAP42-like protein n=1 Tax=Tricharina praecox TaxID=43433 RepID=UPI00221FE521|nr:TAP42-like protein [Tricharina praecox]KAI5848258.1 TAP42-like protein [Tricharina praecox]
MASSDDQQSSISSLLREADILKDQLSSYPDTNGDEYQTKLGLAIKKYQQCKDLVARASLLSLNESLEDLATSDMRCLAIPFTIAELNTRVKSPDRKPVLLRSVALYKKFISLCDAYDLVSSAERTAAENAGTGKPVSVLPTDPGARRTAKIAQFKAEKELKAKIESLANHASADDEDLREFHKASLKLAIMQTIQSLEMIMMELDMLAKAPPPSSEPRATQEEEDDARRRGRKNDGYNEKLDSIPSTIKGGNLLTKDGKPLRPFVLLDKRQQLKDGVFGSGHNLPTMTIDEYLEEERRRGGIIEGGGEKSGERPEVDEDDYEAGDAATMKARAWDEYTEQNPKGSGNTLNRG